MMSIGFRAVRVRCHGDLARIEVNREDRKKLFDENLLDQISEELKKVWIYLCNYRGQWL